MTISYSEITRVSSSAVHNNAVAVVIPTSPIASGSTLPALPSSSHQTGINHLILDAGPLLSLTPLRHLASTFHTTPPVINELRDPKARDHWERLSLSGVDVRVELPNGQAMAKVVAFAKKTGDYAVLSQTDLSVIALTYQYEVQVNGEVNIRTTPGERKPHVVATNQIGVEERDDIVGHEKEHDDEDDGSFSEELEESTEDVDEAPTSIEQVMDESHAIEPADDTLHTAQLDTSAGIPSGSLNLLLPTNTDSDEHDGAEATSKDNDGEGDWITPSNVSSHRNHDLGLLSADGLSTAPASPLAAACMTGDFAVQNVLLGMGLGLVGEGGKRISKVKSFVLRCHACFKICKDPSKRFCPSCGNPSLLRTTVTTSSKTGEQKIHLKKNFQYHLRGTKFTIPDAKPGRAKGQLKGGSGLILREDQAEWQDAVRSQERRKEKEDRRLAKGALQGWNDPDWLPEIITVGVSGKGRSGGNGMPTIGHGRKNPNQARRKR